MEFFIRCNREQADIIMIALTGYLNHYRSQLRKAEDKELKSMIKERIEVTEKMLEEMGA